MLARNPRLPAEARAALHADPHAGNLIVQTQKHAPLTLVLLHCLEAAESGWTSDYSRVASKSFARVTLVLAPLSGRIFARQVPSVETLGSALLPLRLRGAVDAHGRLISLQANF